MKNTVNKRTHQLWRTFILVPLLLVYSFTVVTIDFHHNHDHCIPDNDEIVVTHLDCESSQNAHETCPVMILTHAHAPIVVYDLPKISQNYSKKLNSLHQLTSHVTIGAVGRSPPFCFPS